MRAAGDPMIPETGAHGEKPRSWKGKELILVVEDSRMIAHFLKRLLESEGFDVLIASDGLGGLEAARRDQPGLVVTDYHMPRMHGLEMVKALRTDPLPRLRARWTGPRLQRGAQWPRRWWCGWAVADW